MGILRRVLQGGFLRPRIVQGRHEALHLGVGVRELIRKLDDARPLVLLDACLGLVGLREAALRPRHWLELTLVQVGQPREGLVGRLIKPVLVVVFSVPAFPLDLSLHGSDVLGFEEFLGAADEGGVETWVLVGLGYAAAHRLEGEILVRLPLDEAVAED